MGDEVDAQRMDLWKTRQK